jgi:hypothetical protein
MPTKLPSLSDRGDHTLHVVREQLARDVEATPRSQNGP